MLCACLYLTRAENCDPTRVFESDCCELLILPFRQDLIQMTDDADLEEFVRSAFHDDTPLEKHVSVLVRLVLLLSVSGLMCCHSNEHLSGSGVTRIWCEGEGGTNGDTDTETQRR